MDLLLAQPLKISTKAVQWRLNNLFQFKKCSCGKRFNRSHILSCNILDPFKTQLTHLEKQLHSDTIALYEEYEFTSNFHYNWLDLLLNNGLYELFYKCACYIEGHLVSNQ